MNKGLLTLAAGLPADPFAFLKLRKRMAEALEGK